MPAHGFSKIKNLTGSHSKNLTSAVANTAFKPSLCRVPAYSGMGCLLWTECMAGVHVISTYMKI
jgi:hypothetical protein